MKSVLIELFRAGDTMKNADMPSAARRSCCGTRSMPLEILISADDSALGRPVIRAEPRSAVYSR